MSSDPDDWVIPSPVAGFWLCFFFFFFFFFPEVFLWCFHARVFYRFCKVMFFQAPLERRTKEMNVVALQAAGSRSPSRS